MRTKKFFCVASLVITGRSLPTQFGLKSIFRRGMAAGDPNRGTGEGRSFNYSADQ